MTLQVTVKNSDPEGSPHNARVHVVHFSSEGTHAADGVILRPGEERTFTIYGIITDPYAVRLAIEEEYTPEIPDWANPKPTLHDPEPRSFTVSGNE